MVQVTKFGLVLIVVGCSEKSQVEKRASDVAADLLRSYESDTHCAFYQELEKSLSDGCIERRSCSWTAPTEVAPAECASAPPDKPGSVALLLFLSGNVDAALAVSCGLCQLQGKACTCDGATCASRDLFVPSLALESKLRCGVTQINGVEFVWGKSLRAVPDNPLWRPTDSQL